MKTSGTRVKRAGHAASGLDGLHRLRNPGSLGTLHLSSQNLC